MRARVLSTRSCARRAVFIALAWTCLPWVALIISAPARADALDDVQVMRSTYAIARSTRSRSFTTASPAFAAPSPAFAQRVLALVNAARARCATCGRRTAGYREQLVGENIAFGPSSPEEVVRGWLHSPGPDPPGACHATLG